MSRAEAFKGLDALARWNDTAIAALWGDVSGLFLGLIQSEQDRRVAERKLLKAWDEALISRNYAEELTRRTIDIIVGSSYSEATLRTSIQDYEDRLLRSNLFTDVGNDKRKLSTKIRDNSIDIVNAQKALLKKGFAEGRTVVEITREISARAPFPDRLPAYLRSIERARVAGKALDPQVIKKVTAQVGKLKTSALKKSYANLIKAVDLNKNVAKALEKAISAKSKYLAGRLAQSEAINTINDVKNQRAIDKGLNMCKSITSGRAPCNQCKAIELIGYIPVESASIATHHTGCYCSMVYEYRATRPAALTQSEYTKRVQKNINELNAASTASGDRSGYTYGAPPQIQNLRRATIRQKLGLA